MGNILRMIKNENFTAANLFIKYEKRFLYLKSTFRYFTYHFQDTEVFLEKVQNIYGI
jgi:hypothetical protein